MTPSGKWRILEQPVTSRMFLGHETGTRDFSSKCTKKAEKKKEKKNNDNNNNSSKTNRSTDNKFNDECKSFAVSPVEFINSKEILSE